MYIFISMKLQFLIPRYNEPDNVISSFLNSLFVQRNINFNDIGVIIVNDGSDTHLSNILLNVYPFEIKYFENPHLGVSATRNRCLKEATADYVMFCDADDVFYNSLGVQFILNSINTKPFDVLTSAFYEELKDVSSNRFVYSLKENDFVFVHGKVYNREFLINNNIKWDESLLIHEDSYFNGLALSVSTNSVYCNTPFYLWCWNANSVSRKDPLYVIHTYNHLLKSADHLSAELIKRNLIKNAAEMFTLNVYQTFFLLTGKFSKSKDVGDYLTNLSSLFKNYYNKYRFLLDELSENDKFQIINNARNAAFQRNWYEDNISFKEWLKSL